MSLTSSSEFPRSGLLDESDAVARNMVAGLAGVEVPTTLEILNMEKRDRYFVGEKIGPWPIFFLGSDELVAGRDNKHMDLSVRRQAKRCRSVVNMYIQV